MQLDRTDSLSPKMATLLAHLLEGEVAKVLDSKGALDEEEAPKLALD